MTTPCNPPTPPFAVGDVIDTVEQAESLPVGTIAVSRANAAFRKVGTNKWWWVDGKASPSADYFMAADLDMAGNGDQIIYLPRGEA